MFSKSRPEHDHREARCRCGTRRETGSRPAAWARASRTAPACTPWRCADRGVDPAGHARGAERQRAAGAELPAVVVRGWRGCRCGRRRARSMFPGYFAPRAVVERAAMALVHGGARGEKSQKPVISMVSRSSSATPTSTSSPFLVGRVPVQGQEHPQPGARHVRDARRGRGSPARASTMDRILHLHLTRRAGVELAAAA